jgi:hypothetical protein
MAKYIFSERQMEVLTQVHKELSEHFSNHVLIVFEESEDCTKEATQTLFHGGALMARALMYEGIDYIRDLVKANPRKEEE